ncbi:MAG: MMPL family transporter [Gordonia sp. (in: high G+C Gram-positive bacteria)]
MFGAIGTFVYRMRFAVIAVMVVLMAGLGLFGLDLNKHLSQSGWFDPTSQSSKGSVIADTAFGRDHRSDVIVLITPPAGTTVDDPAFGTKVEKFITDLLAKYPDIVQRASSADGDAALRSNHVIIDPFYLPDDSPAQQAAQATIRSRTFDEDRRHAFISIGIAGNDDTTVLENFKRIQPEFANIAGRYDLPGTTFELAGLQPVAGAMARGMDADIHRAELIALPLVALMLFFIFGGVVAACLPVFIGGLTIAGSLGIMKILALATELNIFAQSVVTLIGLGIAIDYGLFIVSRFREELADGYSTKAAVRRTVMTSGQTVVFSATIIVAALACLLINPQGFLKSVAYGAIASVSLAAVLSITVLPAILGILGPRVDAFSLRWMLAHSVIPVLRKVSAPAATRVETLTSGKTRSRDEIVNGFWGRLSGWVMQHPVLTAAPTVVLLLILTVPFGGIKFGGISEAYLPPDNVSRIAQEHFDTYFPKERTEEIKLVISYDENDPDNGNKIQQFADAANRIPGFTKKFSANADDGALTGTHAPTGAAIIQLSAGLVDRNTAGQAIKDLRAIPRPAGLQIWVAGTPTLTQDSIDALLTRLPLMTVMLVLVTGLLMFLAFGSLVLPIKAALMSALGLGATLGILTWIFVDGNFAGLANFTPGPLFAAVLVLIIAIVFGLSTDYEIFLLSRMVEARQKGATTTESIRVGTALTGRIITAAAAILVVVTGAFGLSDIVMMKYIAYGMIAALILDATVIRMLLVPSVMKLLGDDCWWAPRWLSTVQHKIGLGETVLDDEPDEKRDGARIHRNVSAGTLISEVPTSVMGIRRPAGRVRRPIPAPPPRRAPAPGRPQVPVVGAAPASGPRPIPPVAVPPVPVPPVPVPPTPVPPVPPAPVPTARNGQARSEAPRTVDRPDTGGWRLGEGGIRLADIGRPQPAPQRPPAAAEVSATARTVETQRPLPQAPVVTASSSGPIPADRAAEPAPNGSGTPSSAPNGSTPQTPAAQTPAARRLAPESLAPESPVPTTPEPDGPAPESPATTRDPVSTGSAPNGSPLSRRPELDQTGARPLAASLTPEQRRRTDAPRPSRTSTGPSPLDRGLSEWAQAVAPPLPGDPSVSSEQPVVDRHAQDSSDDRISVQDLLRRSRSASDE